jgi:hypothetical protein
VGRIIHEMEALWNLCQNNPILATKVVSILTRLPPL